MFYYKIYYCIEHDFYDVNLAIDIFDACLQVKRIQIIANSYTFIMLNSHPFMSNSYYAKLRNSYFLPNSQYYLFLSKVQLSIDSSYQH